MSKIFIFWQETTTNNINAHRLSNLKVPKGYETESHQIPKPGWLSKKRRKRHSVSLCCHALLALVKLWSHDRYWGIWERLPGTWSRKEKALPSLKTTQVHSVHSVGTEIHSWGFLPATAKLSKSISEPKQSFKGIDSTRKLLCESKLQNYNRFSVGNFVSGSHVRLKSSKEHVEAQYSVWCCIRLNCVVGHFNFTLPPVLTSEVSVFSSYNMNPFKVIFSVREN